jgi:secreted trypsin-like serine protease
MKVAAALLATTAAVVSAQDVNPLILGGTTVPVGAKTYTVGLRQTAAGSDFCGGSLITPTHILTAAHCAGSAKYVAVGTHFLSGTSDGVRIRVKKETPHPGFTDQVDFDYNIIELASPVTAYAPVKLLSADSETFVGSTATVMGWGTTRSDGNPSNVLLRVDVPVVSDVNCKAAKIQPYPITKNMFCAGGVRNKDSCQGDSGGPLILERTSGDVLIGVVSWGEDCGLAGKPGVYAKVSTMKSWILANAPNATFV